MAVNRTNNPTAVSERGDEELNKPGWMTSLISDSVPEQAPEVGCLASIGKGVVSDFKETIGTHWKSEMVNFNQKTVAVSFFLFFACIVSILDFDYHRNVVCSGTRNSLIIWWLPSKPFSANSIGPCDHIRRCVLQSNP